MFPRWPPNHPTPASERAQGLAFLRGAPANGSRGNPTAAASHIGANSFITLLCQGARYSPATKQSSSSRRSLCSGDEMVADCLLLVITVTQFPMFAKRCECSCCKSRSVVWSPEFASPWLSISAAGSWSSHPEDDRLLSRRI